MGPLLEGRVRPPRDGNALAATSGSVDGLTETMHESDPDGIVILVHLAASGIGAGRVNALLWLIGGVGGLVGLGFLIRSHTQHRALRTGTYVGAPNSATMVTVRWFPAYDDGPVSPELVLVDPALRARLAMHESVLHDEPVYANVDVAASTYVPTVPMDSGDPDSPVYPEQVLVDPVMRADLAVNESVPPEIVEHMHAQVPFWPRRPMFWRFRSSPATTTVPSAWSLCSSSQPCVPILRGTFRG